MARLRGEERARYVSRMFGRISRRYDLLNTVMTGGMHYAWRRMAAYTAVGTGLDGAALDVACGTGDFAFDLARRPNIQHVVGLDFVPDILALAGGKAERQGLTAQTTFTVGDAHALPFEDDSFVCATVGF
ncbi:MAG: methyltransferase domain-containing protein, partial [Chloroflexi bacterium]|nr:methyltransferase domain-containing protein [Chloroflexota bacterium]